jgi:hypothetical protein
MKDKDINRFWSKVIKKGSDECWEWDAGKIGKGYGSFCLYGKTMTAHRISYIINKGDIPKGGLVLHTCDNPACVNPNHLYIGTYGDNNMDREDRNPGTSGRISKFTKDNIQHIKEEYSKGSTQGDLSMEFGVSRQYISNIINNKRGINLI